MADSLRDESPPFKVKLPLITGKDFDFVRRERNTITTPVVKAGHRWDFKHVKHLCGQGKHNARLNVIKESEIADVCNVNNISSPNPLQPANPPQPPVINVEDQEPSISAGHSFFDERLANLTAVFPEEDPNIVRDVLMRYEDVDIAAQSPSDKTDMIITRVEVKESVAEVLKRLKKEMEVKAVLKS